MTAPGKNSTSLRTGGAKGILCLLLIAFSICQSISSHAVTAQTHREVKDKDAKVFTIIKSGVLPSSTKLEVISQELPWMEEIHFKLERTETPFHAFNAIVRRFYVDLFRVITPSNAP
ncbi:MAG: hypothetical protein WKF87_03050 [Chryseolinea sp.]